MKNDPLKKNSHFASLAPLQFEDPSRDASCQLPRRYQQSKHLIVKQVLEESATFRKLQTRTP